MKPEVQRAWNRFWEKMQEAHEAYEDVNTITMMFETNVQQETIEQYLRSKGI